jgi:cleavage and polyadenylation specificity factor subunit 3
VSKDYSYTLLDPRDLRDFAGLSTCTLVQRQKIVLGVGWHLVKWHLEGMFGSVEEGLDKDGIPTMRVSTYLISCTSVLYTLFRLWESLMSSIRKSMN